MKLLIPVFAIFLTAVHCVGQSSASDLRSNQPTSSTLLPDDARKKPSVLIDTNLPAKERNSPENQHRPEWVANAIALLNILIVAYIFWKTNTLHRQERSDDLSKSVGAFWVQELILRPNIDQLHAFFNKYEEEMVSHCGRCATNTGQNITVEAQEKIIAFKKDFHELRRKVVEPLVMVSSEFNDLQNLLSAIEDLVTVEYGRIPGVASAQGDKTAAERFRDLRKGFFGQLHRCHHRLVSP